LSDWGHFIFSRLGAFIFSDWEHFFQIGSILGPGP
jgi:hypothetical protein